MCSVGSVAVQRSVAWGQRAEKAQRFAQLVAPGSPLIS